MYLAFPSIVSDKDCIRFWKKVDKRSDDECHLWKGKEAKTEYSTFVIQGIKYRVHRIAYFLHYGIDPGDLFVCHHCDVPACCNPKHLFLGTQLDNQRDCANKDRRNAVRGSKHCCAKLTEQNVLDIRQRVKNGELQKSLALEFKINVPQVCKIVSRRTWKHI